jgi:hypothetical protein
VLVAATIVGPGLAMLEHLKGNTSLWFVNLKGTRVTDAGLAHFERVICRKLQCSETGQIDRD